DCLTTDRRDMLEKNESLLAMTTSPPESELDQPSTQRHRGYARTTSCSFGSLHEPPAARAFKSLSQGIRGIARAQVIVDQGLPHNVDVVALVRRIALTLAFPDTFQKATQLLFERFAEPCGESGERKLSVKNVPEILGHWNIPEEIICPSSGRSCGNRRCVFRLQGHARLDHLEGCGGSASEGATSGARQVLQQQGEPRAICHAEHQEVRPGVCDAGLLWKGLLRRVLLGVPPRVQDETGLQAHPEGEETNVPAEEVQSELEILKRLDHPNVLRVFEWFEQEDSFLLVLEAAEGGDLRRLLLKERQQHCDFPEAHPHPALQEAPVRALLEQAMQGLAYCHSTNIIHRDIKPANMLLASADMAKPRLLLADFGVAEIFQEQASSGAIKGSLAYMAPEVFANEVCPLSDVWAMGIVAFELLSGERPYNAENPMAMYVQLRKAECNVEPVRNAASEEAVAFIERLLVKDPSSRPLAKEALRDPWLADSDKKGPLSGRQARKARKSIVSFAQMSHFSKAALNCMAAQLDTHKIEDLAGAFADCDTDNDGKLSTSEFAAGLAEMGVDLDVIHQLVASVDMDCDGHINYTEFVASLLQAQGKLIDEVVFHAFQIFDLNGDGHISLDELRTMLSGNGPLSAVLPDGKTVEQALRELDTSNDGVVSFDEFKAYLAREGHATNANPEDAVEVDSTLSLESILRQLAPLVGRPEAELVKEARRVQEEHWITTVADLKSLTDTDWQRLALPLKLEKALRNHLTA
ncbi:unnamed protein product, partial [Effrenium voratum]